MKVFFPGPYSPPQQLAWGTPARTCCCGQHLDNAGQVVFPEASCSAPLHPQGTSISGSQQIREKIWRRSAGSCRLVLLCQPSHSAEYMLNSAAGLQPTTYFSSTPNSHQWVCKQLPLYQTGWLVPSLQATGGFSTFTQPLPELWHLLRSSPSSSRGACSCCPQHENQGLAPNPTRGRIGPPCRTSAYQLVTLTDSICRESLWKMQSIIRALLIFCFCCIYSWFMALRGG